MKFTFFSATRVIGGFWICPFAAALAFEPPPDNAEPPAALLGQPAHAQAGPATPAAQPEENVAFLGLATASVPSMVADHVDLQPGSGVIVRTVSPDSPADKAGLSANDIILSIDDTAVGDPEALSSAIRSRNPGDRIRVELIHRGKPSKVEVTLAERPADQITQLRHDPMLEGLPKAHADRLRGLIEQNVEAFRSLPQGSMDQGWEDVFRQMRQQANRALEDSPSIRPDENGGIRFQQNSTIRMMDNDGSIEIKSADGSTDVTVRDGHNEVVWSGPWQTAEDKAAAPDEIRERVERVRSGAGKGFSFRFGKLGAPDTIDN